MTVLEEGASALAGVTVLEIGTVIASAYAGRLLADLGAEVRTFPLPARAPVHGAEPSAALRAHLDRGKPALDAAGGASRDPRAEFNRLIELNQLIGSSDVVVESLGAGVLEQHGADTKAGVLVRISPFGSSGPYRDRRASSLSLQAAGGWAARIGTPEGPPYFVGGEPEQFVAGAFAASAALSVLRYARENGKPASVDVSIFECIAGTVPYPMLQKITFDRLQFPVPQRYQPIPGIMRCRDGHVGISALTGQHWSDVCALIGTADLAAKMREVTLRGPEWIAFLAAAEPWLLARDAAEIVETFQALRVPAVPIGNGANLPSIEPFASRSFYVRDAETGVTRPGVPWRVSYEPSRGDTPPARTGSRPAHDERGWGKGRPGLPLSGVRVLDLTTFWAGPYLTMYLASMGADVIKVESPKRPDGFRFVAAFPELGERWWEQSGVFHATNLGKRGLTLDLDHPRGKALALELAAEADVVAENFSPRVLEHFGLGTPALHAVNPRAIVVRMPGFGLSGPCRDWVGWALTFEQLAGCAERTGEAGGRRFAPGGFADPAVGMHAALVVQAALLARERTGRGCQIEVSQVEVVAAMTGEQVIHHSMTGEVLTRSGNRSSAAAPQGIYRAAGGDEWVGVTVADDEEWRSLCRVLGRADWASDLDLTTFVGRARRHDEIDRGIEAWTEARSAYDVEGLLARAGITAARLMKTGDFYADPQLAARAHFHGFEHPVAGALAYPDWPLRFSFGTPPYGSGAPTLGQHNREILRDVLGLSGEEIDALYAEHVVGETLP